MAGSRPLDLTDPAFEGQRLSGDSYRGWGNSYTVRTDVGIVDSLNEFYKKGCQEKSSASTGGERILVSRSSPLFSYPPILFNVRSPCSPWYTGLSWPPRNNSASFRASIRSLLLPSFNSAFFRGSQTTR
jgi:hypothetical protein